MPYREKIAWLSLIAMAVTFGPYFAFAAAPGGGDRLPGLHLLVPFGTAAIAQAVLLGLGHWFLRRRSPLDARMPLDERDRAIDRRSVTLGYYALIAGMILVGVVMPFNAEGWSIVNAALFAIIIAEVVHYASVVTSYRLQS
ncbi:hypothetical protein Kisp01_65770 [Kineosporia sp. NBRC 101677]|uniref:hypothetical protein n=1 Tax=Kineosporia sp. NBRC 101677 TaxID=3032197 RepID=UPI00249FB33A|nr:hypothetical protein [Kineosporia sp. NBRC 101677]GLY19563.1 hypothetical protein Kisp01_65770 [Kineosporia sp. NBRC 101677]